MNTSFNSSVPRVEGKGALNVVNGGQESHSMYTLAAIVLAVVVLSGFEDGRKALQRISWFLDGMLGGASHTVTLPGPPSLPLVGNLLQVSYTWRCRLDSSDHCV